VESLERCNAACENTWIDLLVFANLVDGGDHVIVLGNVITAESVDGDQLIGPWTGS
jgi:hypothetical protein